MKPPRFDHFTHRFGSDGKRCPVWRVHCGAALAGAADGGESRTQATR
jgi:hypothetical protein